MGQLVRRRQHGNADTHAAHAAADAALLVRHSALQLLHSSQPTAACLRTSSTLASSGRTPLLLSPRGHAPPLPLPLLLLLLLPLLAAPPAGRRPIERPLPSSSSLLLLVLLALRSTS